VTKERFRLCLEKPLKMLSFHERKESWLPELVFIGEKKNEVIGMLLRKSAGMASVQK